MKTLIVLCLIALPYFASASKECKTVTINMISKAKKLPMEPHLNADSKLFSSDIESFKNKNCSSQSELTTLIQELDGSLDNSILGFVEFRNKLVEREEEVAKQIEKMEFRLKTTREAITNIDKLVTHLKSTKTSINK